MSHVTIELNPKGGVTVECNETCLFEDIAPLMKAIQKEQEKGSPSTLRARLEEVIGQFPFALLQDANKPIRKP